LATIFGSGAMSNSIAEIQGNEVIFIIGSNTKEAHPVLATEMIKASRNGAKIIVADPRWTEMARFSYLWLNQRVGTDIALLNAMAHVIVKEGLQDHEFIKKNTTDYEKWLESVMQYTPEAAEKITGVNKNDIIKSAKTYGSSRKSAIYYTMGITQHSCGTMNVNAIANLALLTGNIGRKFTGINPLRGQNNVQGACDAGCLPNVFIGYQRVDIPEIRNKIETQWDVSLSGKPGLMSSQYSKAILDGSLKALYVMGENPILGDPNVRHTINAFEKLDLLIVQDIFLTETARLAHVVFPSATFAEKDGTFTNTERRIQRIRKALIPPDEAKEDSWIISQLATKLGYDMRYNNIEDIFDEMASLWTAIAGVNYTKLEKTGIQWPCPTKEHPGTEYLYKSGFPKGKVAFTPVEFIPSIEDGSYPLRLITGRRLFHYHYASMTGKSDAINQVSGSAHIEINPEDLEEFNLTDGQTVFVSSRSGSLEIKAISSDRVKKGEVFIPMHYCKEAVNLLSEDNVLDPYSKTPRYKGIPVKITSVKM